MLCVCCVHRVVEGNGVGSAAPLFSFTIPTQNQNEQVTKRFLNESSTCRDGTLKKQPNKMGMTPHYFQTIPTSCAIWTCNAGEVARGRQMVCQVQKYKTLKEESF